MIFEAHLRKTSDNPSIPWESKLCPFIRITQAGEVRQAKTIQQKIDLFAGLGEGDLLLIAWPGKWSQDVFVVDDWNRATDVLARLLEGE